MYKDVVHQVNVFSCRRCFEQATCQIVSRPVGFVEKVPQNQACRGGEEVQLAVGFVKNDRTIDPVAQREILAT